MNVRRFDLNLLVAFDVLLRERSVTVAARRLGLTQPAMSNTLARLRLALGDPLFVRTKDGMVPTPKALEVGRAAAAALREIEGALATKAFDPATSDRSFTVSSSDYVSAVLLAPVVRQLTRSAHGVSLRLANVEPDLSVPALESGALDMTLGFYRKVPPGLRRLRLFSDRIVGLVRAGHPVLRTKRTLRDLVDLPHVRIAPQGESSGLLDAALSKRGMRRRTVLTSPNFLLALLAADTDLFAAIPERLAQVLAAHAKLVIVPLPIALPRIDIDVYWHARAHNDEAHAWLRGLIAESARHRALGS